MLPTQRDNLTANDIDTAFNTIREKLKSRLQEKGLGVCGSVHEGLGIIVEEYHELLHAVEGKDYTEFIDEVLDIAVAGAFILASIAHYRKPLV